jgi:hypothetical protein
MFPETRDEGLEIPTTLAHSITGHEMYEVMDTGGQEQVIFDMDQGFPPSGYTQEQMDEIN